MATSEEILLQINANVTAALKELKRLDKAADGVDFEKAGKSAEKLTGKVKGLQSGFKRMAALAAGVGFIAVLKQSLEFSLQLERINSKLKAATNTSAEAAAEFAFLADETDRLRLNIFTAGDGFARLTAAAKGTALEGEGVRKVFTALSEASVVLRLSSEDTVGILTALEQIVSKGTVSSEELRRQLGERLPGAFQIAARAIGKTTTELDKMLRKGQLVSAEFLPLFAQEIQNTFGDQLEEALKGRISQFEALFISIRKISAALGEGFSEQLAEGATKAAKEIGELQEVAEEAGQTLGVLTKILTFLGLKFIFFGESVGAGFLLIGASLGKILLDIVGKTSLSIGALVELLSKGESKAEKTINRLGRFLTKFGKTTLDNVEIVFDALTERFDSVFRKLFGLSSRASNILETEVGKVTVSLDLLSAASFRNRLLIDEQLRSVIKLTEFEIRMNESVRISAITQGQLARALKESSNSIEDAIISQRAYEEGLGSLESRVLGAVVSQEAYDLALEQSNKAAEKFGEKLLGTKEALEEETAALIDVIAQLPHFADMTEEMSAKVVKAIQKKLDAWLALGEEVPVVLGLIVEVFEVVSSAADKSSKKSVEAAKRAAEAEEKAAERRIEVLNDLSEAFADFAEQLNPTKGGEDPRVAQLKKLREELESIEKLDILEPSELARLGELQDLIADLEGQIDSLGDAFGKQSKEIVSSTKDIDEAISDLVTSSREEFAALTEAQQQEIKLILSNLQQLGELGAASADEIALAMREVGDVLRSAGADTSALDAAVASLRGEALDLDRAFESLKSTTESAAASQGVLAQKTGEAARTLADSADSSHQMADGLVRATKFSKSFDSALAALLPNLREVVDLLEAGAVAGEDFLDEVTN